MHMLEDPFNRDRALALWTALVDAHYEASISYSYHERMAPAENYAVVVSMGVGTFPAEKLIDIQRIAGEHECEVHVFPSMGLRILMKKLEVKFRPTIAGMEPFSGEIVDQ